MIDLEDKKTLPIIETSVCNNALVDEEFELSVLLSLVWNEKWWVVVITLFFCIASVLFVLEKPDIYKSQVLLAPASENSKSGAGGLTAQLGGLASLAGLSLGGSATNKTTLALAVLTSRTFINDFILRHDFIKPISLAKGWDLIDEKWIYELPRSEEGEAKYLSQEKLYKKFKGEYLSIDEDIKTGLIIVSLSLMSPSMAKSWLSLLISDLNMSLRERDIVDAEKSIVFLKNQLFKTSVADMQQIFYQLIEQQMKTVMLAEVNEEYALKIIDYAVVPDEKSEPHRLLICIIGAFLGFFTGLLFVLVKSMRKK
jgi:hypothetical protein